VFSGKLYLIINYVTCDGLFDAHRNYLATLTKVVEHRYFHEFVKDVKWQNAMAKEIEALEMNETWTIEL